MGADPQASVAVTGWDRWLGRALLAATMLIVVGGPIVAVWRGSTLEPATLGPLELFAGQLVLAAFLGTWFVLCERRPLREFLCLPVGNWPRRLGRGIRLGLSAWLLTLLAMAILRTVTSRAGLPPAEGFADLVVWLATRPVVLRLGLILSAMTLEEAFFRGFLQPRIGLLAATLCFALSHLSYGSPAMGGGVFVVGLLLGRSFQREGDLAVCMIAHGIFDGIQLLVILPWAATQL